MKITGVRTFVVGNPTPGYGGRYFIFLKLETDAGIEGVGEVYVATVSPQLVAGMIEDVVARHVAGREPFHIEATWRDVYAAGYARRPDPTLVGRALGHRDGDVGHRRQGRRQARATSCSAAACASGCARTATSTPSRRRDRRLQGPGSRAPTRAAEYADARLHRAQVRSRRRRTRRSTRASRRSTTSIAASATSRRCARPWARAATCCSARTGSSPSPGAIRLARRLERFDPLWFEEPTPPESPEEMARVARATSIPIATGERLTTKHEFARVLETRRRLRSCR